MNTIKDVNKLDIAIIGLQNILNQIFENDRPHYGIAYSYVKDCIEDIQLIKKNMDVCEDAEELMKIVVNELLDKLSEKYTNLKQSYISLVEQEELSEQEQMQAMLSNLPEASISELPTDVQASQAVTRL